MCPPTYLRQVMLPSKGLIKVIKFKAVIRFGSIYIMAHSRWRYDKNVMMVSAPPGRLTEPGSVGLTQTGVCALRQGTGIRFSNWKCFINTPFPHPLAHNAHCQMARKIPHRERSSHCHSVGDRGHGKFVSRGQAVRGRIWASVTTF